MQCNFARSTQPCWGPVNLIDSYKAMTTTVEIYCCTGHLDPTYLPQEAEQRKRRLVFPPPSSDAYLASDDEELVPGKLLGKRSLRTSKTATRRRAKHDNSHLSPHAT